MKKPIWSIIRAWLTCEIPRCATHVGREAPIRSRLELLQGCGDLVDRAAQLCHLVPLELILRLTPHCVQGKGHTTPQHFQQSAQLFGHRNAHLTGVHVALAARLSTPYNPSGCQASGCLHRSRRGSCRRVPRSMSRLSYTKFPRSLVPRVSTISVRSIKLSNSTITSHHISQTVEAMPGSRVAESQASVPGAEWLG